MIVLVLIVVVLIVVVLLLRAKPSSTTGEVSDATRPANGLVPMFDIVALGVSGSGKTVLLASMFHELHVQRAGRPYILETDTSQRVTLSAVYQQVRDTTAPWPRGTKVDEARQFHFTCSAFANGAKQEVLRVRYLDYAGELLESARPDIVADQGQLQDHIRSAHALIGVIDGYRLLQFLRGEAAGHQYVNGAIQPMIGEMSSATCPIHFVITKWDVVGNFGEPPHATDDDRLRRVREALLSSTAIGDLVRAPHIGHRIVRLIPVSAVGPDFVLADDEGVMHKQSNAHVAPANVDLPFASVVPDLFQQIEASLTDADRRAIETYIRKTARLDGRELVAAMAKVVSMPAKLVLEFALGKAYGAHAVGLFLDWLARPIAEKSARFERLQDDHEQSLADRRTVRSDVVRAFENAVLMLEARLPSSNLSREHQS